MRCLLPAGFITGLILNIGEAPLHGAVLREAAEAACSRLNFQATRNPMSTMLPTRLTLQGKLMACQYTISGLPAQ